MKIRLRQKVDQGGADSKPLLPGQEFEVYNLRFDYPGLGVYIKLQDGSIIHLEPGQFTYIG